MRGRLKHPAKPTFYRFSEAVWLSAARAMPAGMGGASRYRVLSTQHTKGDPIDIGMFADDAPRAMALRPAPVVPRAAAVQPRV